MTSPRRLPRRGHDRARSLIARLRETLYSSPEWALFDQVRNRTGSTGGSDDVLRIADALAVYTWGPRTTWRIHGFEVKLTRKDWLVELDHPEKCSPLKLFCAGWYLVVPAPWKAIVLSLSELPAGWGLIEVGTGEIRAPVVAALEREAEEPTPAFLHALLRAASTAQHRAQLGGAPLVPVARAVSRQQVILACGHSLLHPPLVKAGRPEPLPCLSCKDDLPTDLEAVLAAIADADPAQLATIAGAVRARVA